MPLSEGSEQRGGPWPGSGQTSLEGAPQEEAGPGDRALTQKVFLGARHKGPGEGPPWGGPSRGLASGSGLEALSVLATVVGRREGPHQKWKV